MKKKIWLIGTGNMGLEYLKVLALFGVELTVIGRGEINAQNIRNTFDVEVISGGLESYLNTKPSLPDKVIVAVNVFYLASVTQQLLDFGVKEILLEKPGGTTASEIITLAQKAQLQNAKVFLAYNRRFYASVRKAKELIEADGGLTACFFEFTEWAHQIQNLDKKREEFENWFLANSSHVLDTAFYLCGKPKEISCFTGGEGQLKWHSTASSFAGAGIFENGALFSYMAHWASPGRWNLEIMTTKHRFIFRPMEKLQVQEIGSVQINFVDEIDYSLDEKYKPGLYLQTKSFLEDDFEGMCTLHDQSCVMPFYQKIAGY